MVGMLQIEESRIKWQGGGRTGKKKDMVQREYHDSLLSPASPTPQHFSRFLSTFHSILYHSTLFKHLEQAKNSEKNKQGIFCFSSY